MYFLVEDVVYFCYIFYFILIIFLKLYTFYYLLSVKCDPFEYMMREKVLFIVKQMNLKHVCQFYLVNERSPVRVAFQQHTTPQFWILSAYQIAGKTFEERILIANLNEILNINFKVRSEEIFTTDFTFKSYFLSFILCLLFYRRKSQYFYICS